jgi:hypothetical protein
MSRGDDILTEFRILRTKCGLPTAEHVPSGILLHSRVDPVSEAADFVAARASTNANTTVLLGGGLGYVAEALAQTKGSEHLVYVVEPDIALMALAYRIRSGAAYFTLPNIRRMSAAVPYLLTARSLEIAAAADLLVAPYFERIAAQMNSALSGFLQILRAERASKIIYDPILSAHRSANALSLDSLASALDIRLDPTKQLVVAGAGPSLTSCLDALHSNRNRVVLIAASGAVPPLQTAGIVPDWVIALEGKDEIIADLQSLSPATAVVVFPSTHPQILAHAPGALFSGSELESRGGTTAIPALDFALRCSRADVFLVGMDLGYFGGSYAVGALRMRAVTAPSPTLPPKFIAMRAALENLMQRSHLESRTICHVLADAPVLKGTRRLLPHEFSGILALPQTAKECV